MEIERIPLERMCILKERHAVTHREESKKKYMKDAKNLFLTSMIGIGNLL